MHPTHPSPAYGPAIQGKQSTLLPDDFTFEVPARHTPITDIPRSSDDVTTISFLTPGNIAQHSTQTVNTMGHSIFH